MDAILDHLPALGTLALLHLASAAIPGPNTIVIGYRAASGSVAEGLRAAAGVVAATLVWVIVSLAGVGVLLQQAGEVYATLRLAGAAYLVYAGGRLLLSAAHPAAPTAAAPARAASSSFRAGLLTTFSNAKSAVFWTSVFVVALPLDAPFAFQAAAVALVAIQSATWYGLVALAFSAPPARRAYRGFGRWLDGIAGGVMVLFGLKLALEENPAGR